MSDHARFCPFYAKEDKSIYKSITSRREHPIEARFKKAFIDGMRQSCSSGAKFSHPRDVLRTILESSWLEGIRFEKGKTSRFRRRENGKRSVWGNEEVGDLIKLNWQGIRKGKVIDENISGNNFQLELWREPFPSKVSLISCLQRLEAKKRPN